MPARPAASDLAPIQRDCLYHALAVRKGPTLPIYMQWKAVNDGFIDLCLTVKNHTFTRVWISNCQVESVNKKQHKLTLSFRGKILKVYHAEANEYTIGSEPGCDIQIDNLAVEPLHAKVTFTEEAAKIESIDPKNEIRVNGGSTTKHVLKHGDEIEIGKHTIRYIFELAPVHADDEGDVGLGKSLSQNGWLQFLNGPKMGRTFRLERSITRVGKTGSVGAMISSREDGYYISHLEGSTSPKVGNQEIGEQSRRLNDGDTIAIGDMQLLFFVEGN